jgi:hypothetical protein
MSLGWGLRGFIGGGPLGAMIPGVMVALALCILLDREHEAGWIVAFGAIGVGFGGQETYGQTVGLALQPETFVWAMAGFALKGAIWGLLGGAFLGIGLTRERYSRHDLIAAFAVMVLSTYGGWKLINEPKLIYFSNRLDRPRAELWAGLLLGALALLLWLSVKGGTKLPWRFALWGALGGGVGFATGAALQVWGRNNAPTFPLGWWKIMEFTFGALLGLSYGYCAWRHRKEMAPGVRAVAEQPLSRNAALGISFLLAAVALTIGLLYPRLGSRLSYTIAGAALASLALFSRTLSWHIGITLTYCAFAIDLLRNRREYPEPVMWVFVVVTTLAVALCTTRQPRMRPMFLLITITAVAMSMLKSFLPPVEFGPQIPMEAVFVLFAIFIGIWAQRYGLSGRELLTPEAATRT